MFGMPDLGGPLVPDASPNMSVLNTASMPVKRSGMFGGGNNIGMAISAALNGYLAAGGNPAGLAGLQQLHQMRLLQQKQALDDAQYQRDRQDSLTDFATKAKISSQYKEPGEFEQALIASGVQPGTPEWVNAMKTKVNNILDPAVMTPQGLMLRSQVTGAMQPQVAPPNVTFTPIDDGGPTPPASGGFPY